MKLTNSIIYTICLTVFPILAHAYVGPGTGLSAVGSVIAFIGAIFLLIVGFLWYPIKRLIKGNKTDVSAEPPLQESHENLAQENSSEIKKATPTSNNDT